MTAAAPATLPAPGSLEPTDFSFNRFHLDLTARQVRHERVACTDLDDVLGGIARGFKPFDDPALAVDDAYDPRALVIMNLGILSGTDFMTGLRTYFVGYSPLKVSNAGKPATMWSAGSSKFGVKLRYLGCDEVWMRGRFDRPTVIRIHEGAEGVPQFEFQDAEGLLGLKVNDKVQRLLPQYPDAHFAFIGPAGESYESCRYAAIALSTVNQQRSGDSKPRWCGRGGFGGVLGSKNLIGIIADVKDKKTPATPERVKELNKEVARGEGSRRFRDARKGNGGGGTWANYQALGPVHAAPEYNFMPTGTEISVPLYRPSVEAEGKVVVKDEACFRCGIACHKNVYTKDEKGKPDKYLAKLDFEPLNLLASNIGIFDIEQACELVELVDAYGMDSISCGVTLSYAMEYNRRHPEAPIAGGLSYGDFHGTRAAIEALGTGRLPELGQGTKRLATQLGDLGYAMQCKGIEFPAYLPQTNPGYPWALAGGHMSMRTYLLFLYEREASVDYWVDAVTTRGLSILRDDLIGVCKFCGIKDDGMAEAIGHLSGLRITPADLQEAILRAFLRGYRVERRQGFGTYDYVMPEAAHQKHDAIDLPYFNSKAFFACLKPRVLARFDFMARQRGLDL